MPEIAGRGKFVIPFNVFCHCARSKPGVVCHCVWVQLAPQLGSPQSISCDATCAMFVSESNTLLLGSMTAMSTTTATTSCMPSGATWQHSDGGVGVAIGVPVGVGVAIGVGVGVVGHAQTRVSHGMSLGVGASGVGVGGATAPGSNRPLTR